MDIGAIYPIIKAHASYRAGTPRTPAFFHTYSFPILLLKSILKCISFMHNLQCKFQCMLLQGPFSNEFQHTINVPTSYPLRFNAVASFFCHESNSKTELTQN